MRDLVAIRPWNKKICLKPADKLLWAAVGPLPGLQDSRPDNEMFFHLPELFPKMMVQGVWVQLKFSSFQRKQHGYSDGERQKFPSGLSAFLCTQPCRYLWGRMCTLLQSRVGWGTSPPSHCSQHNSPLPAVLSLVFECITTSAFRQLGIKVLMMPLRQLKM